MEKYLASQFLEWFFKIVSLNEWSDFYQYMEADIINPNHYWSWSQFHVSMQFLIWLDIGIHVKIVNIELL